MSDWTSGYVADIDYTYGYYAELNPARIKLAFIANGLVFPENGTACELGFGQGVSTNIHAVSSAVSWWGTDFNPSQAGFAQQLSRSTGAHLSDSAFMEFCSQTDLPDFDFIALHGIWSWISDQNREVIVDFVRRKLKVGGVLYISYNTLPGWSTAAPLRHLLTQHKDKMGGPGLGTVTQVNNALTFTQNLLDTQPLWVRSNPAVLERFTNTIKPQNRNYLAHEYFNRDWHPMYFADMAQLLESAKLNFACSANYADFIDAINLTAEHQAFLKEISDQNFRQTIRDFMVSQQFRKDYWVKGVRRLNAVERSEQLRAQAVVLCSPRSDISLKAKGSLGEAAMSEAIYNPILDLLANYQPKTIGAIEEALKSSSVSLAQIEQAILLLVGQGSLHPAQDAKTIEACKAKARKYNEMVLDQARGSGDIGYLASPVTGGGIAVNRFSQLFILAQSKGKKTPEDWAAFAWNILADQGQRIIKDGKTLETAEENLAELSAQANQFSQNWMPILKALQII